jgi:hypothetical protein
MPALGDYVEPNIGYGLHPGCPSCSIPNLRMALIWALPNTDLGDRDTSFKLQWFHLQIRNLESGLSP